MSLATKSFSIWIAVVCLAPGAYAQQTWTQSVDNTTIVAGSASCYSLPMGITDNSYWRKYEPLQCGLVGDYEVLSCTFGVEDADATSGMQRVTVNLRVGTGFPAGASAAPILGTATITVTNTDVSMQTFETVTFAPPVFVPAGTHVAVEVMAYNGMPQGDFFFIGSNNLGENPPDSSYISAIDCQVPDPVPYSSLGWPNVKVIIDLECRDAAGPINTNYCTPAVPNSTGNPGEISGVGSTVAAAQNVVLTASSLPPNQFGYFIASRMQGFIAMPGSSSGNLCVVGSVGRYRQPSQIGNSGAGGAFSLQVGNIPVPTNPLPGETILPGDTWNWQCWYRDVGLMNNFTDAISVTFN